MKYFVRILYLSILTLSLGGNIQAVHAGEKAKDIQLLNPLSGFTSNPNADSVSFFTTAAGNLVSYLLVLLTVLSIIPIVIGGIYMTSSSGNQEMVQKGKSALVWGVIGLVLGLSSFVIYNFVLQLAIQG